MGLRLHIESIHGIVTSKEGGSSEENKRGLSSAWPSLGVQNFRAPSKDFGRVFRFSRTQRLLGGFLMSKGC